MKNKTNITGRLENLDKLTGNNSNDENADGNQPLNSIDSNQNSNNDTSINAESSQIENINPAENNLLGDSPSLPNSMLLEKKISTHSIFDAVDDENLQNLNSVNLDKGKTMNNLNNSLNHITPKFPNQRILSIIPSSNIDTTNLINSFEKSSNKTSFVRENNKMTSIFETNLEDESNKEVIIPVKSKNLTKINKTIEKFDFHKSKILKNNTITNITEMSRLVKKNKNNIMLEIGSNKLKNKLKSNLKKPSKLYINSSEVQILSKQQKDKINNLVQNSSEIEIFQKQKQNKVEFLYKLYMERKRRLKNKLAQKNKPPLFDGDDLIKVKRLLKRKDPLKIKKQYESPNDIHLSSENIITNEDVNFGPIRIKRKAYEIDPNIPHYGYIGQQLIYGNLPDYDRRMYRGINELGRLI